MCRSVCSACSRCSISHCEVCTPTPFSSAATSSQAPAMPYSLSSLSSAVMSRMAHLRTQTVVTVGVRHRRFFDGQVGFNLRRWWCSFEPVQHVLDVLGTRVARFEHQFDGDQHGIQSMVWDGR